MRWKPRISVSVGHLPEAIEGDSRNGERVGDFEDVAVYRNDDRDQARHGVAQRKGSVSVTHLDWSRRLSICPAGRCLNEAATRRPRKAPEGAKERVGHAALQ
jgi:hypothetical protein